MNFTLRWVARRDCNTSVCIGVSFLTHFCRSRRVYCVSGQTMTITEEVLNQLLKDYRKPEHLLGQKGLLMSGVASDRRGVRGCAGLAEPTDGI